MTKNPVYQLLRMARQHHNTKLKSVKRWARGARKLDKVSCGRCAKPFCCSQFVCAQTFEGTMIAYALMHQNDKEVLKAVIDQGKRMGNMITEAGCQLPYQQDEFDKVTKKWFDLQEPCALLKDGKCALYGLRPVACSSYLVFSPPEGCGPPSEGDVCAANGSGPLGDCIALDSNFLASLIDFGDDTPISAPIPLGIAVLYGVALLTEGPDALRQFIRKERPFGTEMEG